MWDSASSAGQQLLQNLALWGCKLGAAALLLPLLVGHESTLANNIVAAQDQTAPVSAVRSESSDPAAQADCPSALSNPAATASNFRQLKRY